MRWWELASYASLLSVAAGMRLWDLASRAMHHDESLHAFYSWKLYAGQGYQHIPMMHGPFQFEANAALFFVFGDSDFTARMLYALLGTALVGLPFFFRGRLGRLGALLVATMLAFSPVMLYYSRFARNDILMALWTLGLVICMWRYIDEGRNRYLYLGAALLALAFATKETAYIATAVLGLFLVVLVTPEYWAEARRRIPIGQASPPVAAARAAAGMWSALRGGVKLSAASRPGSFLVLLVTLTLPLWSALVSVFQDTALLRWSNLVLAAPESSGLTGAPTGGGILIAALVVMAALGFSAYWGSRWNWPVWWRCALIFYVIWVLLYTTFFTNLVGIGSGMWQSMGYWVVQQGEARGNQPWYYYFVITSIYEFLPLLFGVIGIVYYLRRKDLFGHFLAFWAVASFILYIMASEKMPWLMVNVALPLIVLTGKFLADVVQGIEWRRLRLSDGILLLAGVPSLALALWGLAFFEPRQEFALDFLILLAWGLAAVALVVFGTDLARRSGARNVVALSAVTVAVMLLGLTVRTAWVASYRYGDTPVEMLVYTQTSPDITRLMRQIERTADATGQGAAIPITIDQTSGFTWPWAWYLRDFTRVSYPSYQSGPPSQAPEASMVLVHSLSQPAAEEVLKTVFTDGERIRHRWWFPEETYRGLILGKFLRAFGDRKSWRAAMDYFLYRKGVRDRLGSEDAYLYLPKDSPGSSSAAQ